MLFEYLTNKIQFTHFHSARITCSRSVRSETLYLFLKQIYASTKESVENIKESLFFLDFVHCCSKFILFEIMILNTTYIRHYPIKLNQEKYLKNTFTVTVCAFSLLMKLVNKFQHILYSSFACF
jgi:hypothetical protein